MAGHGTGEVSATAQVGFGERLLSGVFRGCCLMMRAAARCCGVASNEEASEQRSAVDFQALALLGYAPIGEIAAAQRELRTWQNPGTSTGDPPVEAHLLHLPLNRPAPRTLRVATRRQRSRRSARLSHGRA